MVTLVQKDMWKNWKSYLEVNRRFASACAERLDPEGRVWVHDYQLALVPALLRQMVPGAAIGFFLHIPFPPADAFRILPWREEILEGILGADLVGFHTHSYLREFARSAEVIMGAKAEGPRLIHGGKVTRIGVFPMGVDARAIRTLSESARVSELCESFRRDAGGRAILLGVDRLDYSKGLERRLLAVERLLEREPGMRDAIRMIQVVVPSRTKVESYALLRRRIDELVGRINGVSGTLRSVPIHYIYNAITQEELVALYRAANVMVVTPLKDGMNLVAKEFVASRPDGDGVLVLSEFAGAAAEMGGALQVNPYDVDGLASALHRALTMPVGERRARMASLGRRVTRFDSYKWAEMFLQVLDSSQQTREAGAEAPSSSPNVGGVARAVARAPRRLLLLDYDGTLAPFAMAPDLASPDEEVLNLLSALSQSRGTSVHLISGRPREVLDAWFGALPIGLHAEHGYWSRTSHRGSWRAFRRGAPAWKAAILEILDRYTDQTPGSLIEEKTAALTWHYRMADPELAARIRTELLIELREALRGVQAQVLEGHKIVEIRTAGVHKGVVARRLLKAGDGEQAVLAMGDDRTDEDLFAALPPSCFTIHVGAGTTLARHRLPDPQSARAFLRWVLSEIEGGEVSLPSFLYLHPASPQQGRGPSTGPGHRRCAPSSPAAPRLRTAPGSGGST